MTYVKINLKTIYVNLGPISSYLGLAANDLGAC